MYCLANRLTNGGDDDIPAAEPLGRFYGWQQDCAGPLRKPEAARRTRATTIAVRDRQRAYNLRHPHQALGWRPIASHEGEKSGHHRPLPPPQDRRRIRAQPEHIKNVTTNPALTGEGS